MKMKNFRHIAIYGALLGVLSSGLALAYGRPVDDFSFTTTWDTFTTGLASGKWYTAGYGTYWATDAKVQGFPHGLYAYAPGVNSVSGRPAFTLSSPPENITGFDHPGAMDHMKWTVFMQNMSSVGYRGFDTYPGYVLSCSTQITGQTFGTHYHPFSTNVSNSGDDVRLAIFGQNTYDEESQLVFDFMFTNKRVYAIYERLPYGRTEWGGTGNYAAFTYAIPVATRTPSSKHAVKISYHRTAGVVQWFLDGVEVYRVSQIGRLLTSRANMIIDLGGVEETVTLRQLNCGMGMFTLLDGAKGNGNGLVRLSQNANYLRPSQSTPSPLSFFDENSLATNRLWGEGAEMHLAPYVVSNLPAGILPTQPVFTEPPETVSSDVDGVPVTGDVIW